MGYPAAMLSLWIRFFSFKSEQAFQLDDSMVNRLQS